MRVGTKSVLFGAHCFFIHPWFVAAGWWKLYGFPRSWRLWVCFFVHDLGYWGKPNMDGPEGETHPVLGARIASAVCDVWVLGGTVFLATRDPERVKVMEAFGYFAEDGVVDPHGRVGYAMSKYEQDTTYFDMCLYHSRFYAKAHGVHPSPLCAADKLAVALEPWWLYLPRVWLSGELREYMDLCRSAALGRGSIPGSKYGGEPQVATRDEVAGMSRVRAWHYVMTKFCREWAYAHAVGEMDTWTKGAAR